MRTIRWGMIGTGDVTEVKSGPGFQKAAHSELVAVMRRKAFALRRRSEGPLHGSAYATSEPGKSVWTLPICTTMYCLPSCR